MNEPCPNCVTLQQENTKLKSELEALKTKFKDFEADAEEMIRRAKAKASQPAEKPRPGTTRVDFSKM